MNQSHPDQEPGSPECTDSVYWGFLQGLIYAEASSHHIDKAPLTFFMPTRDGLWVPEAQAELRFSPRSFFRVCSEFDDGYGILHFAYLPPDFAPNQWNPLWVMKNAEAEYDPDNFPIGLTTPFAPASYWMSPDVDLPGEPAPQP